FEMHPEDDDDEDPEEDPVDYPADGADDGDDEEESSEDDEMDFESRVRQDMDEIYTRLDDEQTERQLLAEHRRPTETLESRTALQGQITALQGQVTALQALVATLQGQQGLARDSTHPEPELDRTRMRSTRDASDLVHGEVMSLRTTVLGQMSEIRELQAVDRRRQTVILELLRIDHRRSTEISELRTALQGQVTALQGQVTALQAQVTTLQGQQGLAGSPTQLELPEEAGGSA
nr:hypothetical protein [Tanacetum cinerariifolium]